MPTPDAEARRALAEEAIFARFAAKGGADQLDPYLDQPSAVRNGSSSLFHGDGGPEEADPALRQALYESVQQGAPPIRDDQYAQYQNLHRDSRDHVSARSVAVTTAPRDIVVKIPPAPRAPSAAHHSETDDDLEYVDIVPAQVAKKPATPAPLEQMILSDTDASDEFEEVRVASTTPAPPQPRAQPLRAASGSEARATVPPTSLPPIAPARSLLDSVLPSDSESETEQSLKRKVAPLSRGPGHELIAPIRLSPSPDPFERFESSQQSAVSSMPVAGNGVHAQDFAQAAAAGTSRATRTDVDDDASETPAPARSATPLRPQPRKSPSYNGGPSPAELPASVPPSEKALDAIQTSEMAILPDVLEGIPSPEPEAAADATSESAPKETPDAARSIINAEPEPTVQYLDDLDGPIRVPQAEKLADDPSRAAKPSAAKPSKARPTVQYLEDLENPTAAGTGPTAAHEPVDVEEFFSDWSRSPSPQPRAAAADGAGDRGGDALFLEDDDPDAEDAALAMMREEEAYADVMAQLRNGSIESMRLEAEKEVARLLAQKRAEMRNADGVTRQMAIDIRVSVLVIRLSLCLHTSDTGSRRKCSSSSAFLSSTLRQKQRRNALPSWNANWSTESSPTIRMSSCSAAHASTAICSTRPSTSSATFLPTSNARSASTVPSSSDSRTSSAAITRTAFRASASSRGASYSKSSPATMGSKISAHGGRRCRKASIHRRTPIRPGRSVSSVLLSVEIPRPLLLTLVNHLQKSGHRQLVIDQGWPSAEVVSEAGMSSSSGRADSQSVNDSGKRTTARSSMIVRNASRGELSISMACECACALSNGAGPAC